MQISVILTTYNQPDWLEKVLWGYATQRTRPYQIVIADDGSDERTREVVDRLRCRTGLRLEHVWHEDEGFRKCEILNKAITEATGDYLLFSDGDCIPRRDFIEGHLQLAERGRFLSGGYYKLPMPLSQAIKVEDIQSGRAFHLTWLRRRGLPLSRRMLRLVTKGRVATLLDWITTTKPTWNGNNSSGWAEDIRRAGGFDQRMRYGGLDRELGERLENAGIRGKQIRQRSVCLHLDHARGYANPEDRKRNLAIRQATRSQRLTATQHGLPTAA